MFADEAVDEGDRLCALLEGCAQGVSVASDLSQQQTIRRQYDGTGRQWVFIAWLLANASPIGSCVGG